MTNEITLLLSNYTPKKTGSWYQWNPETLIYNTAVLI